MKTIHRSRFLCVLSIAAGAVLVPAAAAQVATAGGAPVARPMVVRARSAPAATFLRVRHTWPEARSRRPAAAGRVVANVNPATYADTTGDSGTAPDITGVVVSNDAGNQITFRVNVVKLVVPSDGHIVIAIDSDRNASTGYQGVDYMFLGDLSTNSFGVGRWNGSDFVDTHASSASASTDATGVSFSINSSDLGNTAGFSFWARTLQGSDVTANNHDDAPDAGTWDYQLGPTAQLKLSVGLTTVTKARAGKPFVAAIEVVRSDGADTTLTPDDVTCAARVGARPLKARTIVGEGPAAGCGWLLPKKSRGKTLHASVTAALDGATVTKTFAAKIK
jgi:hypothetical protein